MFRNILFILCIAITGQTTAQTNTPASKNTENGPVEEIDYKQMGAPLPPFHLVPFYDTTIKNAPNTEQIIKDSIAKKNHQRRKKRPKNDNLNEPRHKFITNSDVDDGANLFVMIFNPGCSHCEDETELLEKYIYFFNRSKLLLVATPIQYRIVPLFLKEFHIAEFPSITVGTDSTKFIDRLFLYSALPQINIYNADRKLIRTFSGEVGIDSLKQYIQ